MDAGWSSWPRVGRDLTSRSPPGPICTRALGPGAGVGQAAPLLSSDIASGRLDARRPAFRGRHLTLVSPALGVRAKARHWLPAVACSAIEAHAEDLDLDFQGLDFSQISTPGTPDLSGIAPEEGMHSGDADLELTMEDLVQATDGDLAALGVMPSVAGDRPVRSPNGWPNRGQTRLAAAHRAGLGAYIRARFRFCVALDSWPGDPEPGDIPARRARSELGRAGATGPPGAGPGPRRRASSLTRSNRVPGPATWCRSIGKWMAGCGTRLGPNSTWDVPTSKSTTRTRPGHPGGGHQGGRCGSTGGGTPPAGTVEGALTSG